MAAPIDLHHNDQSPHLIDELEGAFQNCISLMTSQEHFNIQDSEETKTSVDNAMMRFLDLSRQIETFFLRKRFAASYQKPEQYVSDDITDLKAELMRKDQLLEKHLEKLKHCQMVLQAGGGGPGGGVQPHPQPHPQQPQQSQTQPQHASMGQGPLPQYTPHPMQQMTTQGSGMGHFPPGSVPTPPIQTSPMQSHPMGMPRPQPPSYPQGPLAYLEQTTSNIGMPDRR